LLHPRPLQKQKAYHWRIFTPANNQTIWPLQWWIITPAFLPLADFYSGQQPDYLAASVVDYCSGVLIIITLLLPTPVL